jgi:hypothetical protein
VTLCPHHGYQRNTVDLDLLIRKDDADAVRAILEQESFSWRREFAQLLPEKGYFSLFRRRLTVIRIRTYNQKRFPEGPNMQILVLVEPLAGGRVRARAGDPLNLAAEGATAEEATRQLGTLLDSMMASGCQITTISVANGQAALPPASPLPADNLYQTDWVFRELQEAIAEGRRQDEAT